MIEIDVEQAFSGSPKEEASRIAGALREGQHCVVTTRPNHAARHGIEARCRERGLSRAAYGEHICAGLPTSRHWWWRCAHRAPCTSLAAM